MQAEIEINKLSPDAAIPYELLLLADETIEAINKYLPGSDIYIARVHNEQMAIGVMVLQPQSHQEIEIKNIAVARHLQSKGIGKAMIDKAVEIAGTDGYTRLIVGTGDCGFRQIKFYEQNGFRICGKRENFFIDNFPEPIYENGMMLKDMVILERAIKNPPLG